MCVCVCVCVYMQPGLIMEKLIGTAIKGTSCKRILCYHYNGISRY